VAEVKPHEPGRGAEAPKLAVIIPTLNEAERLPYLLRDLARLSVPHRVIVVDGGSSDGTQSVASTVGAEVVSAPPGRARQLNVGVRVAAGSSTLLFLHADCRLPVETRAVISSEVERGVTSPAVFRFRLEGDKWFWRFIEFGQRIREATTGLAYGDQGLLISGEDFQAAGGYPVIPLMEDVAMLDRLRQRGPIRRLRAEVLTSPRRYQEEGRWRAWVRNTLLVARYLAGGSPERLAASYATRDPARPVERSLLVFAKAPLPGKVKTRLARAMGDARAAELYRRMGKAIIEAVRGGDFETSVVYSPAEGLPAIRAWLGDSPRLMPQADGDLGRRMNIAITHALETSGRVCLIGTDSPDLDAALVSQAFEALGETDVVLGPARDGGYYLIALSEPHSELFEEIPWSTDRVLESTLTRASAAGLAVRLLETLTDVDEPADVPAWLT
jgi:rSAM/selenodomain-associated transferase 2/rSAM/selenodomain-associated transferase 1